MSTAAMMRDEQDRAAMRRASVALYFGSSSALRRADFARSPLPAAGRQSALGVKAPSSTGAPLNRGLSSRA